VVLLVEQMLQAKMADMSTLLSVNRAYAYNVARAASHGVVSAKVMAVLFPSSFFLVPCSIRLRAWYCIGNVPIISPLFIPISQNPFF